MAKNYITLPRGEAETGLKFNNGTVDFLGELTGLDNPIIYQPVSTNWKDIKDYATTLLHAAFLSNEKQKGIMSKVTRAEMEDWMNQLDFGDVTLICETWANMISPPSLATGEVGKDTQPRAADMAAA